MSWIKKVKEGSLIPIESGFLDDFFSDDFMNTFARGRTIPAMNIKDLEDKYLVEIAAPGMKKEDFSINLDGDRLIISAEQKEENIEEDENYTKKEFSFSSFKRVCTIPENVKIDEIKAEYNEGILNIELPKKEIEKKDVKEIEIL